MSQPTGNAGNPAKHSALNRRVLLKLAAAGAAVVALPTFAAARSARAAGKAEALLLTCIDYRLIESVGEFMNQQGLAHEYDQVILAGAALGAITDQYPEWNTTFWQHLDLALQLHGISRVIVIDHRDCGAYKLIFGEDFAVEPDRETEVHGEQMRLLRAAVNDKYPDLEIELYLIALDGTVETIE